MLRVIGELDLACGRAMRATFDRLRGAARAVTLDLRAVTFIDSAGLQSIIALQRSAEQARIALRLMPPADRITAALQEIPFGAHAIAPAWGPPGPGPETGFIERIELAVACDVNAPAEARAEVRAATAERLAEATCATAVLLASEVVTNAVQHCGAHAEERIRILITVWEDRVRFEARDAGAGFDPRSVPAPGDVPGGRGLFVIDHLASRWGAHPATQGDDRFCVWFEIEASPARKAVA